jgi:2-phospho-L-lactate guanylyltransferase
VATELTWTVLLAIKSLPEAKSRLRRLESGRLDDLTHASLVRAMRADTIAAVEASARVAHIVTIADRAGEAYTLVQSAPGLNAALSEAAGYAQAEWPTDGVVALVADLPALPAADLDAALALAAAYPRAFVPDFAGTGTTMLTAAAGTALDPGFGAGSAARHAEYATALDAGAGLRHDVDTWADLQACAALGLGPHTAAAYREFTSTRHDMGYDRLHRGH